MSNDDRKKNGHDRSEKLNGLRLHRRRFLQALGLLGGGAIAHTGPMIAAARGATAEPSKVFDVSLPASYDVDEPAEVIDVALDGRPTVPVEFHTVSKVRLEQTNDPDVATVRLLSLAMTSNDPNPLAGVGVDTGVITAVVPDGTVIGQLSLATGTLAEHEFPITVSFERNRAPFTANVRPTRAVVSETPATEAEKEDPDEKCNKENDVEVPIETLKDSGLASGTLTLGMVPEVQQSDPSKQPVAG